MPTTDRRTIRHQRLLLVLAAALVLALAGTYAAGGDWSTAAGAVTGGALVLTLLLLAERRARRRGPEAATATRVFSGRGDERDHQVYLVTFTVVGLVGLLASALAPAAVHLGLGAEDALRWLPYLLIGTGVATFAIADRRM